MRAPPSSRDRTRAGRSGSTGSRADRPSSCTVRGGKLVAQKSLDLPGVLRLGIVGGEVFLGDLDPQRGRLLVLLELGQLQFCQLFLVLPLSGSPLEARFDTGDGRLSACQAGQSTEAMGDDLCRSSHYLSGHDGGLGVAHDSDRSLDFWDRVDCRCQRQRPLGTQVPTDRCMKPRLLFLFLVG